MRYDGIRRRSTMDVLIQDWSRRILVREAHPQASFWPTLRRPFEQPLRRTTRFRAIPRKIRAISDAPAHFIHPKLNAATRG